MKKGLGKGLGALLGTDEPVSSGVTEVRITDIEPNANQPRKSFDDEKLAALAESIKQHGVVQPLIVQQDGDSYRIVAGERRWRAARLAGLETVPVIVRDLSDRQVMEVALIENLQREDLNPIEEAEAYEKLISEYGMTQEEVASVVGKSRPAITNSIRLLSLDDEIKSRLISGEISSGHARALLSLDDKDLRRKAMQEIIEKGLSVRETERLIKVLSTPKKQKARKVPDAEYQALEERFREVFGTKVMIMNSKKSGKILIEYYSLEELDRIINLVESIYKNSKN
ncbi:MAG TPA: ParB/RepB/Spo0J family partition protein [Clostridiales bacterium]|nr:ParB/RepB/Spo0J family partition protein [Clostridiales bacterium]HPV02826.1 ParB/RepB/Spo0J family partition protein [Clostridiales bacterium]